MRTFLQTNAKTVIVLTYLCLSYNNITNAEPVDPDLDSLEESLEKSIIAPTANTDTNVSTETQFAEAVVLNKITAKPIKVKLALRKEVDFGNISIALHKCLRNNNPYKPENMALIEVNEDTAGYGHTTIFKGWLFSSTPSLSVVEHPVYDILKVECKD